MSDIEKKFIEHVKLRAIGDNYIDLAEEKEILSWAISAGLEVGKARVALKNYCQHKGIQLESYIEERGRAVLIRSIADGEIDKKEFLAAVQEMLTVGENRIKEDDCKRRMKKVVVDNNWKVRDGFLKGGDWFDDIKMA